MIYTDHKPAHVHVFKAGKEVTIDLGEETTKPRVRTNKGMNKRNRRKALRIASEHQDYLIERWREIHG